VDPDGRLPRGCGDGVCKGTTTLDTIVVRPSKEERRRRSDAAYLAARNRDALDFFRLIGGPLGGGFADTVEFRDNPTPLNAMVLAVDLTPLGKVGGATKALKLGAASEKTAVAIEIRIEKDLGKRSRREFHDMKVRGAGDRSLEELKQDARDLYQGANKPIPEWLQ